MKRLISLLTTIIFSFVFLFGNFAFAEETENQKFIDDVMTKIAYALSKPIPFAKATSWTSISKRLLYRYKKDEAIKNITLKQSKNGFYEVTIKLRDVPPPSGVGYRPFNDPFNVLGYGNIYTSGVGVYKEFYRVAFLHGFNWSKYSTSYIVLATRERRISSVPNYVWGFSGNSHSGFEVKEVPGSRTFHNPGLKGKIGKLTLIIYEVKKEYVDAKYDQYGHKLSPRRTITRARPICRTTIYKSDKKLGDLNKVSVSVWKKLIVAEKISGSWIKIEDV